MNPADGRPLPRLSPLLLPWVEALPLCTFLAAMKLADPQAWYEWRGPYYVATAAAAGTIALFRHWRLPLNRIHLAIALYLASGSIGLAIPWAWLNQFYGRTQATAMLGWVVAVALAGLFLPRERRDARVLLLVAAGACAMSWAFQGSELLSAYVPFIVLFTTMGVVRARRQQRQVAARASSA